ncbi:MAG: hypothetical protein RLZZ324_1285 [Candidatus Parcubacteria bacterium]|jgi:hypothetical protein
MHMKTLVTHLKPHLDDICAFWLLRRLVPELKDAPMRFEQVANLGGTAHDDADTVCVGLGAGKYDEHKGDINDCSTSLVWKDVSPAAGLDADEHAAYQKIVDWSLKIDLGKTMSDAGESFTVPALLDGYFATHDRDSATLTTFGFELLDALLEVQRGEVRIEKAWAARKEFTTPWGMGVAVRGAPKSFDSFAYAHGAVVVVLVNAENTYHSIRASADSPTDLTAAAEAVKAREPNANWFFHHSKRMLICGGTGMVPAKVPSKLTLEELVALVAVPKA